jgi:hypothetical protein
MSDLILKDGTGSGNRVKVDDDNRVYTASRVRTAASLATDEGLAFSLAANELSLTGDTEYAIIRFTNKDPNRNFHVNKIFVGWNGGDTNHDRALIGMIYKGMSIPSANYYFDEDTPSIGPGNLNFGSATAALADCYLWNGTGNGMTVASPGTKVMSNYFCQGVTVLEADGTIMLPFGSDIAFSLKSEETGKAGLVVTGWYQ